jgi:hypothetical protein
VGEQLRKIADDSHQPVTSRQQVVGPTATPLEDDDHGTVDDLTALRVFQFRFPTNMEVYKHLAYTP